MEDPTSQNIDRQISDWLREARPASPLPPGFQPAVWRRIKGAETPTWLDALARLILRPGFAIAAATIVLLAGVLAGSFEGWSLARHSAQMNYLASVMPHALP